MRGMVPTAEEMKRLRTEATMREVYDLRVLVIGGGFQYLKMFFDAGFRGATNINEADILCFTGGSDVSPSMYGEEGLPETYCNPERDDREAGIYGEALALKKPMIGICRGGQFLNVMNGGKMWQHVNKHAIPGFHDVVDMRTGHVLSGMTSTHHQMMIPSNDAEILAVAKLSTLKKRQHELIEREEPEADDMEVLWYPDSLSLCFQPHPEFGLGECRNYFLDLVDEFILPAACV